MTTATRPEMMPWLTPYLCVKDADKALAFYQDAFGFEIRDKVADEQGKTFHAEMTYKGEVIIMMGPEGSWGGTAPASSGVESPVWALCLSTRAYCDNVDQLHEHAVKTGAKSVRAPEDTFWVDMMCSLTCPDGHSWNFATHSAK